MSWAQAQCVPLRATTLHTVHLGWCLVDCVGSIARHHGPLHGTTRTSGRANARPGRSEGRSAGWTVGRTVGRAVGQLAVGRVICTYVDRWVAISPRGNQNLRLTVAPNLSVGWAGGWSVGQSVGRPVFRTPGRPRAAGPQGAAEIRFHMWFGFLWSL